MNEDSHNDRRRGQRIDAWFPLEIASGPRQRLAVSRNASATGILLASHARFTVGEAVTLKFKVSHTDADFTVGSGTVVRYEMDEDADLWPHVMAVALEQPLPDLPNRLASQPVI